MVFGKRTITKIYEFFKAPTKGGDENEKNEVDEAAAWSAEGGRGL